MTEPKCKDCNGTGMLQIGIERAIECGTCHGTGKEDYRVYSDGNGGVSYSKEAEPKKCNFCGGEVSQDFVFPVCQKCSHRIGGGKEPIYYDELDMELTESGTCPNCNMPIKLRNPSGKCDHLYYPENVPKKKETEPKKLENVIISCVGHDECIAHFDNCGYTSKKLAQAVLQFIRSKGEGLKDSYLVDSKEKWYRYDRVIDDLIRSLEE